MRRTTPYVGTGALWSGVLVALGLLVALVTLVAVSTAGAQDGDGSDVIVESGLRGFIKFDGIDGESTDVDHVRWSDLATFDQALVAPAVTARAARAVKPTFEDILVAKDLDKAGPKLQEAAATGKYFARVEIELTRNAGESNALFYRYELKNVQITSYNVGTTGQAELTPSGLPRIELGGPTALHSWPVEELSLAFEEMIVRYTEFDETGQPMGVVEFKWDPDSR